MKYSEFRPEEAGRIVIYGGTMAEKDAFEDAFIFNNPFFETVIMPELNNYKKPVFGKYKTACEVMVKPLKKADRKRAAYHNYYADTKWGTAKAYDLCINSRIGIEKAAEIIKYAAEHK